MSKSTTRKATPRQRQAGSPRSRWRLWLGAAGVATVIVLVVVATQQGGDVPEQSPVAGSSDTGAQKPTEQIQLSAAGGSEVGDQAPQFVATTTARASFELPPGKPAVIYFMAGWCFSCIPEAQALGNIHDEYGDQIAVLGVDADPRDTLAMVRQFAKEADVEYGFVRDGDGALTQALDVRVLDTTVITDAQGRIVFRDAVPTDEETLREALTKAGL